VHAFAAPLFFGVPAAVNIFYGLFAELVNKTKGLKNHPSGDRRLPRRAGETD
jgi:hypothetical protein